MVKDKQKIIEISPFDEEILKQVEKYDIKNNTSYLTTIKNMVGSYDKKTYNVMRMTLPVTYSVFAYLNNDKISNLCLTYAQNDLKNFIMYLDNNNINIYNDLVEYAFKKEAMSEVIALVDRNDEKIINELLDDKFIPLFDNNSEEELVPLVKDREFEEEYKNVR